MMILSRIISSNLSWVMTLKIFDIMNAIKIFNNDNSMIIIIFIFLKKAFKLDKNYLQFHEKYIYEFENIFIDKLSNKLLSFDVSQYRIILEDEKMFINDRIFCLFIRYWSQMKDFLNEYLIINHIYFLFNYIASRIWIISKNDLIIFMIIIFSILR